MISSLRITATLAAIVLVSMSATPIAREAKYHKLRELTVGRLAFTNVTVSLVAVKQDLDPAGAEEVPILQFNSGHVAVRNLSGDRDVLSGDIADGTVADPAALARGTFHWKEGRIDSAELSELKLRLKHVSVSTPLVGVELTIPPSTVVFIKNDAKLSRDSSQLDLTVPASELKQTKVEWKDLAFQANLLSTQAAEYKVGMASAPEVLIANARYHSPPIQTTVEKPVTDILPNVKIKSGAVKIDGFAVEFQNFKPNLTAEQVTIDNPDLFVVSEDLPVVGSARVVATNLRIAGEGSSDRIRARDSKTEIDSYTDVGDPDKIIEVLNLTGRLSPEVLLPTNNPAATFIRSTAAAKFFRGLAKAPDKTNVTHIKISGQHHIIDFVESEVFDVGAHLAYKLTRDANPPRVICSVAVDFYAGKVAGSIVASLIDLTYQSRGKMVIATWLTLGSKISPQYGVAGARYVARVSNFLTNTTTGKIVTKVAGEVVSPGDFVCDLLIGERRPPDNLLTELYTPQIMQSISNPPTDWSSTAIRYSTLLDGVARIQLTPNELSIYKKVQADEAKRSAFVTQVMENRETLERNEQPLKDQESRERSQRSSAAYYQNQEDKNTNRTNAEVPLRQGREEEQKIAKRQKEQEELAKQQQQQQQQQLQQTPSPGAQPGMSNGTTTGNSNSGNTTGNSNSGNCQDKSTRDDKKCSPVDGSFTTTVPPPPKPPPPNK
jgi:hypothetical protein